MGQWLVTQNNAQFAVEGLDELMSLARAGKVDATDMVQPPGTTDWLYASEVPELKGIVAGAAGDDEDTGTWRRRGAGFGVAVVALVLVGIVAVGGTGMAVLGGMLYNSTPSAVGTGDLSYSQMLVTVDGAPLLAEPDPRSTVVTTLAKDASLALLAKRGDYYRARTQTGAEGWVATNSVLPMYLLGGGDVRTEFDPLYNPDTYVEVRNASWLQIDKKNDQLTVFRFEMENSSVYPMTDLVLLATIKDSKGTELERVEIPVEGVIPAGGTTLVGTWRPEADDAVPVLITEYTLDLKAESDPDLYLQYTDGIEVQMKATDFTEAKIDLLEVRAVPPGTSQASLN